MTGTTLFISDLHLCDRRPAIARLFTDFLAGEARRADALYILGDLFEYWVGDDALKEPVHADVAAGLLGLSGGGIPIYILHGNRDFLLGEEFLRRTGCQLLPDPSRHTLHGRAALLMHGDSLCTDDLSHQQFRAQVHTPAWRQAFLAKSYDERVHLARALRQQSESAKTRKSMAIMDVNPSAVAAAMRAHGVQLLIHGHTHRPGEHRFALDGAIATRVVLGDWYEQGSVLRVNAGGWALDTLPPAA